MTLRSPCELRETRHAQIVIRTRARSYDSAIRFTNSKGTHTEKTLAEEAPRTRRRSREYLGDSAGFASSNESQRSRRRHYKGVTTSRRSAHSPSARSRRRRMASRYSRRSIFGSHRSTARFGQGLLSDPPVGRPAAERDQRTTGTERCAAGRARQPARVNTWSCECHLRRVPRDLRAGTGFNRRAAARERFFARRHLSEQRDRRR